MFAGAMLAFCALLTDCCQGQGRADRSAPLASRGKKLPRRCWGFAESVWTKETSPGCARPSRPIWIQRPETVRV